jgi:hypothetical protein
VYLRLSLERDARRRFDPHREEPQSLLTEDLDKLQFLGCIEAAGFGG